MSVIENLDICVPIFAERNYGSSSAFDSDDRDKSAGNSLLEGVPQNPCDRVDEMDDGASSIFITKSRGCYLKRTSLIPEIVSSIVSHTPPSDHFRKKCRRSPISHQTEATLSLISTSPSFESIDSKVRMDLSDNSVNTSSNPRRSLPNGWVVISTTDMIQLKNLFAENSQAQLRKFLPGGRRSVCSITENMERSMGSGADLVQSIMKTNSSSRLIELDVRKRHSHILLQSRRSSITTHQKNLFASFTTDTHTFLHQMAVNSMRPEMATSHAA